MESRMKTSVVMATYNGAKYIIEQLDSIRNQTRKVDEVLIFDDCSKDNTVKIIKDYIKQFKLLNWEVSVNSENIGWRKNFINGFHKISGDVVFCADQDDIWEENKIEIMTGILERREEISILASNMESFFEDGLAEVRGHQNIDYGQDYIEQVIFDKMWLEPCRPGCTMAFKARILPYIDKVWFESCAHDLLLWAIGIARGDAYIVNQKLIRYRRHQNVSTPSNAKTKLNRVNLMSIYITLAEKCLRYGNDLGISLENIEKISAMNVFYKGRKEAIGNSDLIGLLRLGKMIELYPKRKSWIADIISAYR